MFIYLGLKKTMGIDRAEKDKRRSKFQLKGPRIWLPLDVLQGAAYASLSFSAKALLIDLAAQLRARYGDIVNNGDLTTAFSVLRKRGWKDEKTIRSAAKRLVLAKLIVKTRQGQRPNLCNLYAVTWLPLNDSPKLDISSRGFQLNAYKLLEKPIAIKLITDGDKFPNKLNGNGKKSPSLPIDNEIDREKIPLYKEYCST